MKIKGLKIKGVKLSTFDDDALAFLSAASITDPNERSAVNNLVVQMKNHGIYSQMEAVYPFVGGSASSHKFNLLDPQDSDAAHRINFYGGWSHSSKGPYADGVNAYADPEVFFGFDTSWKFDISIGVFCTDDIPLYASGTVNKGVRMTMGIDGASTGVYRGISVGTASYGFCWLYGTAPNLALRHPYYATKSRGGVYATRRDDSGSIPLVDGALDFEGYTALYPGEISSDMDKNYLFIGAQHDESGHPGARAGTYFEGTYGFCYIGRELTDKQLRIYEEIIEGFNLQLNR